MKVYTYFSPVPAIPLGDEIALIELWRDNWRANGYEPEVLSESNARLSPIYHQYREIVTRFPDVNPPGYADACWLRWLAASVQHDETVLMTDYDLFNYGWKCPEIPAGKVVSFCGVVPVPAAASPESFKKMCEEIMVAKPRPQDRHNGKPHFLDMQWLDAEVHEKKNPLFEFRYDAKEFTQEGWEDAQMVHYCNSRMPALRPRHAHIRHLRNW